MDYTKNSETCHMLEATRCYNSQRESRTLFRNFTGQSSVKHSTNESVMDGHSYTLLCREYSGPRNSQNSRLQAVLNDLVEMGPVTGIEVFNSAETLVIEVQVPSQQPGNPKSRVRISRGMKKTHDNLFPQRLTNKFLKPRHHSSQLVAGDREHR